VAVGAPVRASTGGGGLASLLTKARAASGSSDAEGGGDAASAQQPAGERQGPSVQTVILASSALKGLQDKARRKSEDRIKERMAQLRMRSYRVYMCRLSTAWFLNVMFLIILLLLIRICA
jgi:hypothetical protein